MAATTSQVAAMGAAGNSPSRDRTSSASAPYVNASGKWTSIGWIGRSIGLPCAISTRLHIRVSPVGDVCRSFTAIGSLPVAGRPLRPSAEHDGDGADAPAVGARLRPAGEAAAAGDRAWAAGTEASSASSVDAGSGARGVRRSGRSRPCLHVPLQTLEHLDAALRVALAELRRQVAEHRGDRADARALAV